MNKQNPTCASCHRVIVAEEGDTCASIPAWQRGRFDYCDTAATVEPTWTDRAIGPRVVGGTYHNGYWGDTYTVEEIYRAPDASQWEMRVRWSDGHTTVHCTGWDAKRDRVVATATVPERASEGLVVVPCVDCRAPLWAGPQCADAHCTPCHMKRLGFSPPQTATVPERAPAGMLAVRVGSDPWTMVPLDS